MCTLITCINVADSKITFIPSVNFEVQNLPNSSLNYKNICKLPNCGGIPANYTYYYYFANPFTVGAHSLLDADLSGGTTFTLEVFACKLLLTFPELLSNQ